MKAFARYTLTKRLTAAPVHPQDAPIRVLGHFLEEGLMKLKQLLNGTNPLLTLIYLIGVAEVVLLVSFSAAGGRVAFPYFLHQGMAVLPAAEPEPWLCDDISGWNRDPREKSGLEAKGRGLVFGAVPSAGLIQRRHAFPGPYARRFFPVRRGGSAAGFENSPDASGMAYAARTRNPRSRRRVIAPGIPA
ncbi:hypothetical protein [Oscillibacter sp.]|uniref:hypothetical protein n=1 Tax=Oscillibacter sp. TaxID=1945593 RepID=UPI00289E71D0|nr:hypothetical protein [Oscillibacter sp.]